MSSDIEQRCDEFSYRLEMDQMSIWTNAEVDQCLLAFERVAKSPPDDISDYSDGSYMLLNKIHELDKRVRGLRRTLRSVPKLTRHDEFIAMCQWLKDSRAERKQQRKHLHELLYPRLLEKEFVMGDRVLCLWSDGSLTNKGSDKIIGYRNENGLSNAD